jgi:hypothetical protein
VPGDCRIYSSDGQLYVQQIDRATSRFGVFAVLSGQQLNTFTGDANNDLKGMAFSPDSQQVALMYHYSYSNWVRLVADLLGTPIKTSLSIGSAYYHYMVYAASEYLAFSYSGSEANAIVYSTVDGTSCTLTDWRANGGACPAIP